MSRVVRSDPSFIFIVITLLIINGVNGANFKSYRGYSLLRANPRTEQQLLFLQSLDHLDYSAPFDVDVWKLSPSLNQSSDIMLNTKASADIIKEMDALNIEYTYTIPDVDEVIVELRQRNDVIVGRQQNDTDFFAAYRPVDEVYSYLTVLESISPSNEIVTIGKSFEGFDLKVLRINKGDDKKIVWLDGGTHAREWISVSTAMYLAASLATARQACDKNDRTFCTPEIEKLFSMYEFRVQPIVNPDGYAFSHNGDRLWRKTRSNNGPAPWSYFCRGVDPNRNYDIKWGVTGASINMCSSTYAGSAPNSESEVKALSDYVSKDAKRTALFVSLHSYSQLILVPFGFQYELPEDYPDLISVADAAVQELGNYGTPYKAGSPARILYPASGTASDWAYSRGIKYSYTFELPDTGDKGFLLTEDRIKPVGEETWAAIKAMLSAIRS